MNQNAEFLLRLLDDEDEQTAENIMAELLRDEQGIEEFLRDAQDVENPVTRRRIHQLQGVLQTRRRRREVSAYLCGEDAELISGLFELHFQWFDNDRRDIGQKSWKKLAKNLPDIADIRDLGAFMHRQNFRVVEDPLPEASDYCIGEVIDVKEGADIMLCVVAQTLGRLIHIPTRIMSVDNRFGLMEDSEQILLPSAGWTTMPSAHAGTIHYWTTHEILRYVNTRLFTCSVASDNFRYIGSLAMCLGHRNFDFLPYPFGKATPAPTAPTES